MSYGAREHPTIYRREAPRGVPLVRAVMRGGAPWCNASEGQGWVARAGWRGRGGAHQARRGGGDGVTHVELARQLLQREGRLRRDRYRLGGEAVVRW